MAIKNPAPPPMQKIKKVDSAQPVVKTKQRPKGK